MRLSVYLCILLSLLSPAKIQNFRPQQQVREFTLPVYLIEAEQLMQELKSYSIRELAELLKVNANLAEQNADRFFHWNTPFTPENSKQAIFVYNGEVYRGLDASTLNNDDILYLQNHLRMMTGLYGSDFYKDIYTADEFIKLRPDTVRIYPTVIMQDTELANLYNSKKFIPYTLEQSVELCSKLILKFKSENIRIIRLGLHYSESLENNSLGNNYHPAFKELCENKIFFDKITKLIKNYPDKEVDFFEAYVNPHSVSKLAGQNKSNIIRLNNMGYKLKIKTDQSLDEYEIYIKQR